MRVENFKVRMNQTFVRGLSTDYVELALENPPMLDFEAGQCLLIDKPAGWTSFDVVAKIRNTLKGPKVGHAGTLDPLATGLLVLCTGRMTKELERFTGLDKRYEAELRLGYTTPCYDAELPESPAGDPTGLTIQAIRETLKNFEGGILQRPPIFSAIRVEGKRAYQAARKGTAEELPPRPVTIHSIDLMAYEPPYRLVLDVRCSKGTYIRSLAHDLGQALGCGAYLRALRRTEIGRWSLADARTITEWTELIKSQRPGMPATGDTTGSKNLLY